MKINPDIVPTDLEEALKSLKEGLTPEDVKDIKKDDFAAAAVHFTVGMMLRNEWSLWDKESILVQWFKKTYNIDHADDISGLILDCLTQDIREKPRQDKELAKQFIEHWKKMKRGLTSGEKSV